MGGSESSVQAQDVKLCQHPPTGVCSNCVQELNTSQWNELNAAIQAIAKAAKLASYSGDPEVSSLRAGDYVTRGDKQIVAMVFFLIGSLQRSSVNAIQVRTMLFSVQQSPEMPYRGS